MSIEEYHELRIKNLEAKLAQAEYDRDMYRDLFSMAIGTATYYAHCTKPVPLADKEFGKRIQEEMRAEWLIKYGPKEDTP